MAMFVGVHELPEGISEDELQKSWEKYKESASKMGIKAINAVGNIKKKVAYCFTEADSEDQVRKAHADVHVDIKDVIEVTRLK